jgi:hypothetical protein
MEVIGALASTSQIIHYCARIVSCLHHAYQRAQGSSTQYTDQKDRVVQLIEIVQLIDTMQLPQTKPIKGCLDKIEMISRSLCDMMEIKLKDESPKFWKRFINELRNERGRESRVTKCFEALEENKTSLTLLILAAHGQTLVDIKLPVLDSKDRLEKIESTLKGYPIVVKEIRCMMDQLARHCEELRHSCTPLKISDLLTEDGRVASQDWSKATILIQADKEELPNQTSEAESGMLSHEELDEVRNYNTFNTPTTMNWTDRHYDIPTRPKRVKHEQPTSSVLKSPTEMSSMQITHLNAQSMNATQINGDIGIPKHPVHGSYHYEDNFANEGSIQINGNIYDVDIIKLLITRN